MVRCQTLVGTASTVFFQYFEMPEKSDTYKTTLSGSRDFIFPNSSQSLQLRLQYPGNEEASAAENEVGQSLLYFSDGACGSGGKLWFRPKQR